MMASPERTFRAPRRTLEAHKNYNDDGLMDQNRCGVCPGEWPLPKPLPYPFHNPCLLSFQGLSQNTSRGQRLFSFRFHLFAQIDVLGYYRDHLIYN